MYFRFGGELTWLAIRRSPTSRTLWSLFFAGMIGDVILEVTFLQFDVHLLRRQPLTIFKLPLWWAAPNSLIDVVVAVPIYRMEHVLVGWRQILIIPIAMAFSVILNTVSGWPSWTAVNSRPGGALSQFPGLLTFAVSFVMLWLIAKLTVDPGALTTRTTSIEGRPETGPREAVNSG